MSHSNEFRPEAEMLEVVRARASARSRAGDRRVRRARIVGAVVVLAAVGAVAATLVLAGGRGHRKDREAEVSTVPATQQPVTGWYVPSVLSDGWKVRDVRMITPPAAGAEIRGVRPCACESLTWVAGDGMRAIVATTATRRAGDDVLGGYDRASVDVTTFRTQGVQGSVVAPRGGSEAARITRLVVVADGDLVLRVAGSERDLRVMRGMAVEWKRNQVPGLYPDIGRPDGFHLVSSGSTRAGQVVPYVRVTIDTPDIGPVQYDLVPAGSRPILERAVEGVIGTPGPVVGLDTTARAHGPAGVVGVYPGADVFMGLANRVDPGMSGPGDLRTASALATKILIGTVRTGASAAEWARFASAVPHDTAVLAPSLAQASRAVATGAPDAPTRELDKGTDYAGRVVHGVQLSMDLSSSQAIQGEPIGGDLLVRNPTHRTIELNECNVGGIQWWLAPEGRAAGPVPTRFMIDCYDSTIPRQEIPPGSTIRIPLRRGMRTQAPATADRAEPFGAPLPAGRYRAVGALPGKRSRQQVMERWSVTLVADPCPALPAAFRTGPLVDPYRGGTHSERDARAAATAAHLAYRSLLVGARFGVPECSRVTAYRDPLEPDHPFAFVRG